MLRIYPRTVMDFIINIPEELLLDIADNIRLRDEKAQQIAIDKQIKSEINYLAREVSVSSIVKRT